jgi:AP endonuclease-1
VSLFNLLQRVVTNLLSGQIGLTAFREIMRDPLMAGIPLILETPAANNPLEVGELCLWMKEIHLLYEIQAIEDDEWDTKQVEIEARWRAERDKLNPPKEKKVKEKKAPAAKGKAKKKKDEEECESHGEESD